MQEKNVGGDHFPDTVRGLKAYARNNGITGYSGKNKAELIDFIGKAKPTNVKVTKVEKPKPTPVTRPIPAPRTKVEKPKPTPVTRPIPAPRTKVTKPTQVTRPIPAPRTKVTKPTPDPTIEMTKRKKREIANLKKKINRAKNKKHLRQKLEKVIKRLVNETKNEEGKTPKQNVEIVKVGEKVFLMNSVLNQTNQQKLVLIKY